MLLRILISFQNKDKHGRVQHFQVGGPTILIGFFKHSLLSHSLSLSVMILCARWGQPGLTQTNIKLSVLSRNFALDYTKIQALRV